MDATLWAGFVAATVVVLLIPGPTIVLVVSYALGQGWRAALPLALGTALGDLTAVTLSLVGVGALLASSAELFAALRWLGAAYLVWLGIKLWRARARLEARPAAAPAAARRLAAHAWLVTTLNPKSLTFFVAFLPQFIDPADDYVRQATILGATFVALAFANAAGYGLLAARAGRGLADPRTVRRVNQAGGALLVGAGVAAASLGRS